MILVLIFLASSPLVILYASGWRLNFQTLKIERTGGMLLNLNGDGFTVKLNGRVVDSDADRFSKALLIANLLPRHYEVEITKIGYQSWKKQLIVKPALVTETKPIILLPEKLPYQLVRTGIADFSFQNGFLIWQDQNNHFFLTSSANTDSALNLTLLFNYLKEKQLKLRGFSHLTKVIPKDASQFLVKTEKNWYLLDTKKLVLERFKGSTPEANPNLVSPDGNRIATASEHLFIQDPDRLLLAEIDSHSPVNLQTVSENVKTYDYDAENNRVYILLNNGDLVYWDFENL